MSRSAASVRPSSAGDLGIASAGDVGTPPGAPIGVFCVVGDQPIFRRGLQATLADHEDLAPRGEAANAHEALQRIAESRPDVVVLDVPSLAAAEVDAVVAGLRRLPRVRCVALVSPPGAGTGPDAAWSGLACTLSRAATAAQLVDMVRRVHRDPHPGATPPTLRRRRHGGSFVGHDLTPRERRLLELMSQGLSNRDIAARLDLALPTVKGHVQSILSKLCADNRTSAVVLALRHQLVAQP